MNKTLILEDFKVGVDNVIFSVDTGQNRLLVLLVKRKEETLYRDLEFTRNFSSKKRIFRGCRLSDFIRKNSG